MEKSYHEIWFRNAYEIAVGDGNYDEMTERDQLLIVGRSIISQYDATMEDIEAILCQIYGPTDFGVREFVIEVYLLYAVSQQCENRAHYVKEILCLEEDVQNYLMQIIKEAMIVSTESLDTDVGEVSSPNLDHENVDTLRDSSFDTCRYCDEKLQRITQLQLDLEARHAEEQANLQKANHCLLQQTNKTVDAELQVVDLNSQLRQIEKQLSDSHKRIEELEHEAHANKGLRNELGELRDQVEVLKPIADKLDASEARCEKLKDKLEKLKDVENQLKKEYNAHSETMAAKNKLNSEVEELRKLKPQLDVYRADQGELKIQLQEMQLRLQTRDEEIARLRKSTESMSGGQLDTLLQTQNLSEELRICYEQISELRRGTGVGEGMSEMNSEVMKQMQQLQAENSDLKSKLSDSSLESLDQLRKELADQQVITSSLQKKLLSTKDALQNALSTIDTLRNQLRDKEVELSLLADRLSEVQVMYREDTEALVERHQRNIDSICESHNDTLQQLTEYYTNEVNVLSTQLNETSSTLSTTESNLVDMTKRANELQVEVETLTHGLQRAADEKVQILADSEAAQLRLQSETDCRVAKLLATCEDARQQLLAEHRDALAVEANRYLVLTADLEDERVQRRKTERLRKFFEAETNKLKTQVQVACGAAGAAGAGSDKDIDSIVKEMRTMQQQLDDANAELAQMRLHASTHCGTENDLSQQGGEAGHANSSLRGPMRTLRGKTVTVQDEKDHAKISSSNSSSTANIGYSGFLEQAELHDKRFELLAREKREMLSKSLEETKEKMELSQKLLLSEREVAQLRADLRKITLEKERAERRFLKSAEQNSENIQNQQSAVL